MSNELNANKTPLKAVILAAGKDATTAEGQSLVLKKLGDHTIVEYVVQNALQVAGREDVYVVVGYRQQEVRDHLGPKFHYVEQEKPRGTGDAVLQVCEDTAGVRRQPADPLRRHSAVSSGIDSGAAQSAPPEAGPPDTADRGDRQADAVWANHSQRRRTDHRHHRRHRSARPKCGPFARSTLGRTSSTRK